MLTIIQNLNYNNSLRTSFERMHNKKKHMQRCKWKTYLVKRMSCNHGCNKLQMSNLYPNIRLLVTNELMDHDLV